VLNGLRSHRSLPSERGAELIEFAFVLPLMLVVFAGIIDFAFMLQRREVVANAAREGARLASMPGYAQADVIAHVNNYLNNGLGAGTSASATVTSVAGTPVVPATGDPESTRVVTVSLTESYLIIGPLISLVGGNPANFGSITLTAVSTMRTEIDDP
jgi:Flp pilus assembly protein TadG